jgi:hypothetical protein
METSLNNRRVVREARNRAFLSALNVIPKPERIPDDEDEPDENPPKPDPEP